MAEHMNQWLGAYLDNELNQEMQGKVEAHLATCSSCQAELEELKSLSKLLKTAARGKSLAPEAHFSARVALSCPGVRYRPLLPAPSELVGG
jgi:anti-sigma factor RsiW